METVTLTVEDNGGENDSEPIPLTFKTSKSHCIFCAAECPPIFAIDHGKLIRIKREIEPHVFSDDFILERQLKSMNIIRNILDVEGETCAQLLGEFEGQFHPEFWLDVCVECKVFVELYNEGRKQIAKWEKDVQSLKIGLKSLIFVSSRDAGSEMDLEHFGIWKKIRDEALIGFEEPQITSEVSDNEGGEVDVNKQMIVEEGPTILVKQEKQTKYQRSMTRTIRVAGPVPKRERARRNADKRKEIFSKAQKQPSTSLSSSSNQSIIPDRTIPEMSIDGPELSNRMEVISDVIPSESNSIEDINIEENVSPPAQNLQQGTEMNESSDSDENPIEQDLDESPLSLSTPLTSSQAADHAPINLNSITPCCSRQQETDMDVQNIREQRRNRIHVPYNPNFADFTRTTDPSGDTFYECSKCPAKVKRNEIERHRSRHNGRGRKQVGCIYCGISVRKEERFHHRSIECRSCPGSYKRYEESGVANCHYKCKDCSALIKPDKQELRRHFQLHTEKHSRLQGVVCLVCGWRVENICDHNEKWHSENSLKLNEWALRPNFWVVDESNQNYTLFKQEYISKYECRKCPVEFFKLQEIEEHVNLNHVEGDDGVFCWSCDWFVGSGMLKAHEERHHFPREKDRVSTYKLAWKYTDYWKCGPCGGNFLCEDRDEHMKLHQSGNKATCGVCGLMLKPESMINHMEYFHPELGFEA